MADYDLSGWKGCPRPQKKVMEGRYVRLEPFDANTHAKELYEASQGRTRYLWDDPGTIEEFKRWMALAEQAEDKVFFSVFDKKSGKIAGRQNFMAINEAHGVLEIGGVLRGSLLAKTPGSTEAIFLFLCYVFDDLGYRRVEWKSGNENEDSKRAALRFGFTYEGVFRQYCIVKGRSRDTVWFSMIDKDWPALKIAYQKWLDFENFDNSGIQIKSLQEITKSLMN